VRVLWIVLLVGCGRFGFDPQGAGDDMQVDDARGDGPGGDGGVGDPDALISGCGTTQILVDDFSDGVIDARWTMVTGAGYSIFESAGLVRVVFPATASADTRAGYRQAATVAFTNTCAIVEIVGVPTGANARAYLRLGTPTLNVELWVQNGRINGGFVNGGTAGSSGDIPFDPVNHRFVRIRNTGGNTYNFEAGPSPTSFPTLLGTQGGGLVMPSPSSLEIGGMATPNAATNAGSVTFGSVTFLGP